MPTKSWHLGKKDHNLDTSAFLYSGMTYADWEVTTLFYAAVHYVDAYLDTIGIHPRSHTSSSGNGRNDMVMTFHDLAPIATEYIQLYKLSRAARYGWPKQSIQQNDVKDAEQWFDVVKATVDSLV
jgi:uncharacterized protein (UPF0332 family)